MYALRDTGEKVQIDVKVVPDYCIRGKLRRYEKRLYQWTAIDECTRIRYLYIFEEHTPENSVIFLKKFLKWFPFEVECIQTVEMSINVQSKFTLNLKYTQY